LASGTELATAYLSLTVSAKGIQKDIAKELGASEYAAESSGKKMGERLASGLKTGAKIGAAGLATVLGVALTKGFGRLSAIENAQASLSGLGNSAEDVSAIMKNALASVKGTAFGMDEAASTAAGAVAAGIKPGEELEKTLRLVGDAATIGGASMGEMGAIFNKVATSNKVQGDVIAQLNDRGIPIVQMLGKQLGVTSEEVTKMASEGKIGFETFRDAMEAGLGGAALKSGETTAGAFKNMMAALSRIGAGLLGGVFPYFKEVFGGITGLLDGLEAKLTPVAALFGQELAGGVRAFGEAWKANDGDITSSGFPGFMERVGYIGRQTFDGIREVIERVTPAFNQLGGPILALLVALSPLQMVFKAIQPVLPNIADLLVSLAGVAATLAVVAGGVLTKALEFLVPLFVDLVTWVAGFIESITDSKAELDVLTAIIVAAGAGFVVYKVGVLGATVATNAHAVATKAAAVGQRLLNLAMKANPIGLLITGISALVAGLVWFFTQTDTGRAIIETAWAGIQAAIGVVVDWFQTTLLPIIQGVISTIGSVFTWLYNNIISPVFGLIKWAISTWWTVASAIFTVAVALIRNTLGPIFSWLYNSIIKPVFGFIGSVISTWWAGAKIVFGFVVSFLRNTLGVAFTWFRDSVIKPVWDTIKSVITTVWNNGIKPIFDTISDAVQNKLPRAFTAAKDGITSAWDKIKDAAKKPVEFVINKVINDGLIGTFNKIPGVDIKKVPLPPGFRKGGYTGDVGVDDVAGVVHGKEWVFTAEQTAAIGKENLARMARNATHGGAAATAGEGNMGGFFHGNASAVRRHGAYFLDVPSSMGPWNFAGAARMWDGAAGVKVAVGRGNLQAHARPLERGNGILGYTTGNNIDMSPSWMRQLGAVQRRTVAAHEMGHALGLPHNNRRSIMQPNLANMASGPTVVDIRNLQSLYPGGSGKAGSGEENPFDGIIDKLMGQFKEAFPGGGMFIDAAGGLAKSGIGQVVQWVQDIKDGLKNIASDVVGKISGFFGGGSATATVYDGGGWLERTGRPQLVQHNKAKPDAVLSSEQWGTMARIAESSARSVPETHIHVENMFGSAEQIAAEWDTKQRRAANLHNLRKVMVG